MNIQDQIVSVDLRMPGYRPFWRWFMQPAGNQRARREAARLWVMIAQVVVDLLTCLLVAWLGRCWF